MHKIKLITLFFGVIFTSYACTHEENENTFVASLNNTYLFGELSDEVKKQLPLEAITSLSELGLYPSDIDINGDYAYVVDSGNNAIHRIHLETYAVDKAYIDLGQNAAPFAVHANDKAIYVSCQGIPTAVYRFDIHDISQKTALFEDKNIKAPTDIITYDDDLPIVLDSEYDYAQMQAKGSLYGLNPEGQAYTVSSEGKNPVFASLLPTEEQTSILFVTAGVIQWDTETIPPERSCLESFSPTDLESTKGAVCMPNESLGRIAFTDTTICVGNALKPKIHCLPRADFKTASTFAQDIAIHDDHLGLTTPVAMDDDAFVVIDFNHDSVSWVQNNTVLNLKLSPSNDTLKGPIDAVYDAKRKQILVLNSTSGSIDVLKVK